MASNIDHPAMRAPSPAYSNASNPSPQRQAPPMGARHGYTSSDGHQYGKSPKPVDEAVTNALDQAQSQTSSQISPELIAQITQNVIKQLQQSGGLETTTTAPPALQTTTIHHPMPQSPSTTASASSPKHPYRVFTPPSPPRHPEHASHKSPPLPSDHFAERLRSPPKSGSTSSVHPHRPPSPFSQGSDTSEKEKEHNRPRGPVRLNSAKEETTLERIWGPLFDEDGHATPRLGQLLRGLAVHIVSRDVY